MIKPGTEMNEIVSLEDWLPTLLAAAGQPNVKESLLTGLTAAGATYKVHLDGYNLLPYLKGETKEWPRKEFVYWTDDGEPAALRFDQWKMLFLEQRAKVFEVWQDPMVVLRVPKMFNLRADPFERGEEGIEYKQWRLDRTFLVGPAAGYVGKWMQSFRSLPAAPEAWLLQPQPRDGEADQAYGVGRAGATTAVPAAAARRARLESRGTKARKPWESPSENGFSPSRSLRTWEPSVPTPTPRTRCHPGTTARPSSPSWTSSRR